MAASGELTAILTVGCLLLFMGAVGKSAQFPLHVWLPDAMEGPDPVSALIHAATMVAAGVYMVGRAFPLFEHAPAAMLTVAFIGGFTAIFAASMGLVATDIKRVMAFSTVSQLGYMMLAMGAANEAAGAFHLFTHAFFKALLFLTAGSVIYALHRRAARRVRRDAVRTRSACAGPGHPRDGRPQIPDADHRLDDDHRGALAGRDPAALRLLEQGRDPALDPARSAGSAAALLLAAAAFALITVFMTAFYMFR